MNTKINTHNESSLHNQIKEWYREDGDRIEHPVDNYIIDLVRDNLLIEIQTGAFSAIKKKLLNLIPQHPVRLVYPIPEEKDLVYVDENKQEIRRRKSPKHADILELFTELIRIPELINDPNFSLETLFTEEEEIRCEDGQGSWRRGGVSIIDHKLIKINRREIFHNGRDFLQILPDDLKFDSPFTNRELANLMDTSYYRVQKLTYCLREMEAIEKIGKKGRAYLYQIPN